MAARMNGKVVVITGASSGIGRATVLAFARCGAAVVAAARQETPLATRGRQFNLHYMSTPSGSSASMPAASWFTSEVSEMERIDAGLRCWTSHQRRVLPPCGAAVWFAAMDVG